MNTKEILILSLFTILMFILIILMFNLFTKSMFDAVMEIQCCGGSPCSDTYYTPLDNKCHLVLCEQHTALTFGNLSKCIYDGVNQSINYLD